MNKLTEQFHLDGFIIAKKVFTVDEVNRIDEALTAHITNFAATLCAGDIFYEPDGKTIKSMFRLDRRDKFFADLTQDPRQLGLAKAIYPSEPMESTYMTYFGKAAGDGTPAPPHQDNGFALWEPPLGMNISIAIDPHTLNNAAMRCNRGSHRLGLLDHTSSGVPGFSQKLAASIDESLYPAVACLMEPGDLMVHHINTVHFSGANRSTQSRRMLTTGYWSSRVKRDEVRYAVIQAERLRLHGGVADVK
ncbi:MAG: phytanoyl-CoA dioxygenase family protein [Planctomycetota bacterium]|nr:phytanoyl-CoA dioxygenase family protein [Planctomycetota bacterium]